MDNVVRQNAFPKISHSCFKYLIENKKVNAQIDRVCCEAVKDVMRQLIYSCTWTLQMARALMGTIKLKGACEFVHNGHVLPDDVIFVLLSLKICILLLNN